METADRARPLLDENTAGEGERLASVLEEDHRTALIGNIATRDRLPYLDPENYQE